MSIQNTSNDLATSCNEIESLILYQPRGDMSSIMVSSDGSSLVVDSSEVSVNTLSDIASIVQRNRAEYLLVF